MKINLICRILKLSALIIIAAGFIKIEAQNLPQNIEAKTDVAAVKIVPEKIIGEKPGNIKVAFDENNPSIMIIESNGEKIRVDASKKTIEQIVELQNSAAENTKTESTVKDGGKAKKDDDEKEDFYAYEAGDEPFDYRLVNVPTPKKVPKGTWNMNFSHRFSQPISPFKESGRGLLGFDSFSASSFGIMYGITDKLYVNAYRSPICQRGLCRTIEVGLGYHVTDQTKKSPVAVSVYGSVEGNENFTQEYTYNLQAMISRDIGKRLFLFFSPAVHINTNGQRRFNPRPDDYFPNAVAAETFKLPAHSASFGIGASFRITPSVMGIFEFTPRTGFKLGKVDPIFNNDFDVIGFKNVSQPSIGIGLQYSIGKHSFTFTLSNTQTTTTSKYNSSNLVLSPKKLIVGFNLFRRW